MVEEMGYGTGQVDIVVLDITCLAESTNEIISVRHVGPIRYFRDSVPLKDDAY